MIQTKNSVIRLRLSIVIVIFLLITIAFIPIYSALIGDLDSDNDVDIFDFNLLVANFGYPNPPTTNSLTPSTTGSGTVTPTISPVSHLSVCLSRTGPRLTPTGYLTSYLQDPIADNTIIDARSAQWVPHTNSSGTVINPSGTAMDLRTAAGGIGNVCLTGGKIVGVWNPATTSQSTYHSTTAVGTRVANFVWENMYVENYGDGLRHANRQNETTCEILHNAKNFTIKDVYMKEMHDDCVENDWGHSGKIENSLFEGCFTGISTRPGNTCANTLNNLSNVIEINNSLLWHKHMQRNDPNLPYGIGELFKEGSPVTDSTGMVIAGPPKFSIHNTIIRADEKYLRNTQTILSYGIKYWRERTTPGCNNGDPGCLKTVTRLERCSNNTFVWLGDGDVPPVNTSDKISIKDLKDPVTGQPCFTITKDISVWNSAVASWKAAHGY